ncbi:MAG: hypothetical protein ACRDPK_18395 [Carbonactinosporaceae bacterium]
MNTHPTVPGDLFARTQIISGLRQLADFLENNPAVPVREYGWDLHYNACGTDEKAKAEVDRIAALLGVTPINERPDGHYIATKTFGRITYEAVHIPARRMAIHRALMSYAPAFDASTDAA